MAVLNRTETQQKANKQRPLSKSSERACYSVCFGFARTLLAPYCLIYKQNMKLYLGPFRCGSDRVQARHLKSMRACVSLKRQTQNVSFDGRFGMASQVIWVAGTLLLFETIATSFGVSVSSAKETSIKVTNAESTATT